MGSKKSIGIVTKMKFKTSSKNILLALNNYNEENPVKYALSINKIDSTGSDYPAAHQLFDKTFKFKNAFAVDRAGMYLRYRTESESNEQFKPIRDPTPDFKAVFKLESGCGLLMIYNILIKNKMTVIVGHMCSDLGSYEEWSGNPENILRSYREVVIDIEGEISAVDYVPNFKLKSNQRPK